MSKYWDPAWAKETVVVKGNADPAALQERIELGETLGYPRLPQGQKEPCINEQGIFRMAIVGPDWTGLVRGPERRSAAELQEEVGRLAFYFICSRPSVRAIEDATAVISDKLKLSFRIVDDDGSETVHRHLVDLPAGISDVSLRSGGRVIVMTGDDQEFIFDLGLVSQMNLAPKPFAPSLFDLKIHYIGRARGELRESCALDRLDSHGRYQEIVEDMMENHPHRDIWLVLGAGTTIETLGGANPGVDINEAAMQSADHRAREMLRERDRIDLTEALLINYFKPERNTHHKDRLDLGTKLMKRCYEAGFTGLLLVYSSMHLGIATYTEASGRSLFHSSRICL
jgi:hypothetical protein